jgi:opacity protein-like surface antigen
MIGYQISNTFSVKFAYRYLKVKFEDGGFLYDISLDGFQLGLGIRF